MTISLFEARGERFKLSSKEEIANISAPGPKMNKKGPFIFFNFETLRKYSVFIVFIFGPGTEIWTLFCF